MMPGTAIAKIMNEEKLLALSMDMLGCAIHPPLYVSYKNYACFDFRCCGEVFLF